MPVQIDHVQVGAFFVTTNQQLRKVTQIAGGRVHYLCKSARIPGRKFDPGHTNANPPLIDSFIPECERLLSETEVRCLRSMNIILPGE